MTGMGRREKKGHETRDDKQENNHGKELSALRVNAGIEQPPSIDPHAVRRFIHKRKSLLPAERYVGDILAGNRTVLSQAITLVESKNPEHQAIAQKIIAQCLPHSGESIRIGITGVPGVGKSSFIESMGGYLTGRGHKLAVLAIDPSSEKSGGSILGDKTRMERLRIDPKAFIRPSPSAGSPGGVARKTRETLVLCEAAGFDVIFIETVGVGQSETAVYSMVDFFLLLMLAGAGDELQGIKRGIMEMADGIAITKADGDNVKAASMACMEYRNALHLFPPAESGRIPRVLAVSAREGSGLQELWQEIEDFITQTKSSGYFEARRREQARQWMYQSIRDQLLEHFQHDPHIRKSLSTLETKVLKGELSSFQAAQILLDRYRK